MGWTKTTIMLTVMTNIIAYFICGTNIWQTVSFDDPGTPGVLELLETFLNIIIGIFRFLFLPLVGCEDFNTILLATISILIPVAWGLIIAGLFRGGGSPN